MDGITVYSDAAAPAPSDAPRKARRLSGLRANGQDAPELQRSSRMPRFGFKPNKRTMQVAARTAPVSAASTSDSSVPTAPPPVDLTRVIIDALGDLDAHGALLEATKERKGTKDFRWYQSTYEDVKDTIKQLKSALREQVERGKRVGISLKPVQEELNGRLQALSNEAVTQRSAAERASSELTTMRARAADRASKIEELVSAAEVQSRELTGAQQSTATEAKRADAAEASLRERDEQLAASGKECEGLRATVSQQQKAAAEAGEAARLEHERSAALLKEATAALESERAQAQTVEAELSASRDAETARAAELETRLGAVSAELSASKDELSTLKEAKALLEKEHAALGESSAATRARLEGVQAQLDEKSATLSQKDADLREALRNVSQMQKDNSEVIQHERTRSQALEDEARSLRTREQEAIAASKAAEAETERARAELELTRGEVASTQAALQHANGERERLAIETAERSDTIQAQRQATTQLEARLADAQEKLASVNATLSAKSEEAESVTRAKHELEVEFRAYQDHHGTSNQQQMAAISELKLTVDRLSQQYESKKEEVTSTQGSLAMQEAYLATLETKLREQERMRRELHNTIQELKGNIRVFCRVRPAAAEAAKAIELSESNKLALTHATSSSGAASEPHVFGFDRVFNPSTGQEAVFAEVDGLVQSSLDGYKVCIFAYGQTGSGKTHTMQGGTEPPTWGIIPRALSKILSLADAMKADGWTWTLSASFLEIYNEALRDLLHDPKSGPPPSYAIKHDEAWGSVVANMGRIDVSSMEQINKLIARAAKARAVGCTEMNAQSSRSHSVFALYLHGTNAKLNTDLHGALHLVDLAGSERLDKSGAEGAALKETQAINKSLSSLAGVFRAKASKASHVPFRNSKLTHLMEPCLSGHGKTLMVVNVAPEVDNSHESLCSLRFAPKHVKRK